MIITERTPAEYEEDLRITGLERDEALKNAPCHLGSLPEEHGPPKIAITIAPQQSSDIDGWSVIAYCDAPQVFGDKRMAHLAWVQDRRSAEAIAKVYVQALGLGYSIAIHTLTHDGRPTADIHTETSEPF